jgi:hypothetical protein
VFLHEGNANNDQKVNGTSGRYPAFDCSPFDRISFLAGTSLRESRGGPHWLGIEWQASQLNQKGPARLFPQ